FQSEEVKAILNQKEGKQDALFFQAMVDVLKEDGTQQRTDLLKDVDTKTIDADLRAKLVAQNKRLAPSAAQPKQEAKVRQLYPIRRILAIAASILVLVFAGTFLFREDSAGQRELNFLSADLPGTMSGGALEEADFQAALNAFAVAEDMEAASAAFESIPSDSPKYAEAQYFLGHIHTEQEAFELASRNFQAALSAENLPNYINRDKLEWNLLLARLGAGEDVSSALDRLIESAKPPINQMARDLETEL
ncbi:MAG: hypothetical protein AAF806_24505, partial [Bacteroidota bacterium]